MIAQADRFNGQLSLVASRFRQIDGVEGWVELDSLSLRTVAALPSEPAIDVADARQMAQGDTVQLVVRGKSARVFISSSGRQHLQFEVEDFTGSIRGIMWQGDWTSEHMQMLEGGGWMLVTGEIDRFQGQPSLIARDMRPLEAGRPAAGR